MVDSSNQTVLALHVAVLATGVEQKSYTPVVQLAYVGCEPGLAATFRCNVAD